MLNAANALVRLDEREIELLASFRHCNTERQDVLQHIADQLAKQTRSELPKAGNVVLLTGRKLTVSE